MIKRYIISRVRITLPCSKFGISPVKFIPPIGGGPLGPGPGIGPGPDIGPGPGIGPGPDMGPGPDIGPGPDDVGGIGGGCCCGGSVNIGLQKKNNGWSLYKIELTWNVTNS